MDSSDQPPQIIGWPSTIAPVAAEMTIGKFWRFKHDLVSDDNWESFCLLPFSSFPPTTNTTEPEKDILRIV